MKRNHPSLSQVVSLETVHHSGPGIADSSSSMGYLIGGSDRSTQLRSSCTQFWLAEVRSSVIVSRKLVWIAYRSLWKLV